MNQDRQLLLKKLLQNTLSEQIDKLKKYEHEDQSFIYLEGESIHLLLVYLLLTFEGKDKEEMNVDSSFDHEIEELCQKVENMNKHLEELLD